MNDILPVDLLTSNLADATFYDNKVADSGILVWQDQLLMIMILFIIEKVPQLTINRLQFNSTDDHGR
jgi:hypothetical protein